MSRFLRTETHAVDLAAVEVVTWTMAGDGMHAEVHFIVGNGTSYDVAVAANLVEPSPEATIENYAVEFARHLTVNGVVYSAWIEQRESDFLARIDEEDGPIYGKGVDEDGALADLEKQIAIERRCEGEDVAAEDRRDEGDDAMTTTPPPAGDSDERDALAKLLYEYPYDARDPEPWSAGHPEARGETLRLAGAILAAGYRRADHAYEKQLIEEMDRVCAQRDALAARLDEITREWESAIDRERTSEWLRREGVAEHRGAARDRDAARAEVETLRLRGDALEIRAGVYMRDRDAARAEEEALRERVGDWNALCAQRDALAAAQNAAANDYRIQRARAEAAEDTVEHERSERERYERNFGNMVTAYADAEKRAAKLAGILRCVCDDLVCSCMDETCIVCAIDRVLAGNGTAGEG